MLYIPVAGAVVAIVVLMLDQWLTGSLIVGDPPRQVANRIILEVPIALCLYFFLKPKMFPKAMFNIGKSASVAESAKTWRNIVGSVILLGIVVAAIGGWIVERFKG